MNSLPRFTFWNPFEETQDFAGGAYLRLVQFAKDPSKATTADTEDGAASASTGASGSTTATSPTTPEDAEASEALDEAALDAEKNAATIAKLNALAARDAISKDIAERAKTALTKRNKSLQTLAKQLADQTIDEETFEWAEEALTKGGVSEKRLGQALISKKIKPDVFKRAIEDYDSGDPYLKMLAVRLGRGDLTAKDYQVARQSLTSEDPDQKWAAQMLAQGNLTPSAFQEKITGKRSDAAETRAEEKKQDPVSETQKEIHDRIMELLLTVDVVMEQLPEEERTKPLQKLRQNLVSLNQRDRKNHNALVTVVRRLQEKENLSPDNAAMIVNFVADEDKDKAKEEFREFETGLQALGLSESAIKNIRSLKMEEWRVEKDFREQARITGDIMKAAVNMIHYETLRERMLEQATKITGIKIKEGTQIQYTYPDPATHNLRTCRIKKVHVEDAPILDGIDGNVIGRQPANLRIILDNGDDYSLSRFVKWVTAADIHETIQSQVELEEKLELPEVGQRLKAGQTLEYTKGYLRSSTGDLMAQRERVNIVSIDDQKVVLEKPVVTLKAEEDPSGKVTRMAREMNLGEFAKWVRRNEATPHIKTADELRELLKNHNSYLNKTWNRPPEEWPPITLKPGEVLQMGGDKEAQAQIDKVDDDGVTFKNGTRMTLPQFLGWVRSNHVERANPEDEAVRDGKAAERLGEEVNQAARDGFLKRALDSFKRKSEPPPGKGDQKPPQASPEQAKKTIFDLFDPLAPRPTKPYGPLRELFHQYTYLSVMDIINLGKEFIEFIKRKHTRRSKHRYSLVARNLPSFLGTEFARVNQAAETEEVNTYKEAMAQWGTWEVLDRLHNPASKDELKACFIVLSEKGEIRWDDMQLWKALNKITSAYTADGAALYIHLTKEPQINPKTGAKASGEDRTKDSVDALWGEGQWAEWFSKNISSYNNAKNAYEYKGKQLEADPKGTGGLTGELQRLLSDWKQGKYVNPMEYEELIDFAIKYGKLTAESKLFFLMEGLTAKCPSGAAQGLTLLHLDRVGELDGKYLNQFPMLDFYTNKGKKAFHPKYMSGEMDLEATKKGYQPEDYQAFIDTYFKEESEKCEAGNQFSKFLWEWMVVDPNFRIRLAKGLRRAEAMDHDDAHLYIPTATMEQIENFTGSYTGNQKYWTDEGYKNGYAGFNQYIVSLSNRYDTLLKMQKDGLRVDDETVKENQQQILEAVQSYFLYDAILSGRRDKRFEHKAHLGPAQYRRDMVVDGSCTVGDHKDQMDNMVRSVCEAYGIDWKGNMLYVDADYNDTKTQEQIKGNMEDFLREDLPKKIEEQGFEKLLKIIDERKRAAVKNPKDKNVLRGIVGSNTLMAEAKKKKADDEAAKKAA